MGAPDIITFEDVDNFGRPIQMEATAIRPKHLSRIFDQLANMAGPHIEASGDGLVLVEPPEHMAFHTEGEPIPPESIEPIASQADRRNRAIQIAVDGALQRAPYVLPSIYDTLQEGLNVGLCFSHNTIQDIPLGFGAVLTRLGDHERYRQAKDDPKVEMVRGMLISQLLKRVGIAINKEHPTRADYVMTMLADHVWSSIPTTKSAHGLRRDMQGVTKTSNDAMKASVRSVQDEGRLFLAGSLSGSTMKPSDEDAGVYIMEGPKDGSMEIALHESMRWLCMALLIEPGDREDVVRAEFSGASEGLRAGELRTFDSPDEINAAMTGLTDTATAITSLSGREYQHVPQKGHRIRPRRSDSDRY